MAASTGKDFPPVRPDAHEPVPAPARATAQPPAEVRAPAAAAAVPSPVPAPAPAPVRGKAPRHEIRALLRAHLAAASGYRHLTRHCAVCARLLRLAMEPLAASGRPEVAADSPAAPGLPRTAPVAAREPARAPVSAPAPEPLRREQTAAHVSPLETQEQTVRPVTEPSAAADGDAPQGLTRRPAAARTSARLAPGVASTVPDGATEGRERRRGPAWMEDESPPAA